MNIPVIKVYDIDYEFIIENYLDTKYWGKAWTIFMYDRFQYTLEMVSIETTCHAICFKLEAKHLDTLIYESTIFNYYLRNSNIDMLKKSIKGNILRLTDRMEARFIRRTEQYLEYMEVQEYEESKLREIAENFLDKEGVSNDEIREVYIDNYISENSQLDSKLDTYVYGLQYTKLTSLWLILANVYKDDHLQVMIETAVDDDRLAEIEEDIKESIQQIQTEEWEEEMGSNLEDI